MGQFGRPASPSDSVLDLLLDDVRSGYIYDDGEWMCGGCISRYTI